MGATLVDAGRIDVDDLALGHGLDTDNTVPGGLRLTRGNGEFLSDQPIEQGGFAHVGPPDQGAVATVVFFCLHRSRSNEQLLQQLVRGRLLRPAAGIIDETQYDEIQTDASEEE